MIFSDRDHAGQVLAGKLSKYAHRPDVLVLAIPRGGVPVAREVARALGAPLDVFVVRKLAVPGHDELSIGAIATGGVRWLNDAIVGQLGLDAESVAAATATEQAELQRLEQCYRGARAAAPVRNRTVILVDDGFDTGASMRAAIAGLRPRRPRHIVAAAPAGAAEVCASLRADADEVVCAVSPAAFRSAGECYASFDTVTESDVRAMVGDGWTQPLPATAA